MSNNNVVFVVVLKDFFQQQGTIPGMSRKKTSTPSAVIAGKCVGRDEMNLAEFPIALLSHRATSQVLTLHKQRTVTLPDGRQLQQEWTVTGAPEYGLPQPCDEDVLLGLLKIAADEGFSDARISFTQRALLQLIRWPSQSWSHVRLEQALGRLTTTKIKATNSFWDKRKQSYRTLLHFGIIDSYQLVDRSSWKQGVGTNWARFSDEFFGSMQVGYIKPLSLDLYFSLESSVAKRLFRYLDKKRYLKERFEIGLEQLASVHVGLSLSKCQFPSWMKQRLNPAHQELIERGFLRAAEYRQDRNGGWKVCYSFESSRTEQPRLLPGSEVPESLVQELVRRGVTARVAHELVRDKTEELIRKQLDVFDWMRRLSENGGMRNPAAFLTKAIREEWTLEPPGYLSERAQVARKAARRQVEREEALQREQLDGLKATIPTETLEALRAEALTQVRAQLGHLLKIHPTSPFVEAALNDLVRQRFGDPNPK